MSWLVDNAIVIIAILGCIGALGTFATFMLKFGLKVGEWKGSVDTDMNAFKTFMQEIKDDIKTILLRLPAPTRSHESPIKLTDLGKQIVEDVRPERWIERYAQELLPETMDRSLYQIQELAFSFADEKLNQKLDASFIKEIEDSAFRRGISVDEVMKALGVVLRDKIFQLKGLSIDDM